MSLTIGSLCSGAGGLDLAVADVLGDARTGCWGWAMADRWGRPVQREGIEYEFTVVGDLDLEHNLVITKSRCPVLADAVIHRPDETFGLTLLNWLNDGDRPTETARGIRDELLAIPSPTTAEVKALADRAKAAGLLGTAIVDETGDTTTLGDWLRAKWNEANADAVKAPAGNEGKQA